MSANNQLNTDSFLKENFRNIELDTPVNLNISVESEKSDSSLSKIEKYICEK